MKRSTEHISVALSDWSVETENIPYVVWWYRQKKKLGYKYYPTLEEAYYAGKYWLRRNHRRYPEGKYSFALGEPVFVVRGQDYRTGRVLRAVVCSTLTEAQAKEQAWKADSLSRSKETIQIVVGYEYEWFWQS